MYEDTNMRTPVPSNWEDGYNNPYDQKLSAGHADNSRTPPHTEQHPTNRRRFMTAWRENHKDEKDRHDEPIHQNGGVCSLFTQCTQETSFSGFKYIGGSSTSMFRRVFWLVIVLAAGCGLCFQVINSTDKFIRCDTNTKVKYVTKPELDFPSVTVCNVNMFRLTHMFEYYESVREAYITGIAQVRYLFPMHEEIGEPAVHVAEFTVYPGNQTLYDFIRNSAHLKTVSIERCQFNGMKCGPENFTTTVTNYGFCYTFNSADNDEALKVTTPGQTQGLSLVLNVQEYQYLAAPRENIGFKVLVHSRNETPNLEDYGIELLAGTHTPIRLDVTEMYSLPAPYGDCATDDAVPLKYHQGPYTENQCYLECETDYIVEKCECRHFYMPGNASYCDPQSLLNCLYGNKLTFAANRTNLCACPDACYETLYKPTLSQSYFPSEAVAQAMTSRGEHSYAAVAFADVVLDSAGLPFQKITTSLYDNTSAAFSATVSNITGSSITERFSWYPLNAIALNTANNVFWEIQITLYNYLTQEIFYNIWDPAENGGYDSEYYWYLYSLYAETFLYSGKYKDSIAEALLSTGEYPADESFEEFVDSVYAEYNLEEVYFQLFTSSYIDIHALVLKHAQRIIATSDLNALTTDYMRENFLSVNIFYGDLKVETIRDQPAYELFQFVCDLGGALGLFFGASLLSFIETVDFWFTRSGGKKDNEKTTIQKIGLQPNLMTVSKT